MRWEQFRTYVDQNPNSLINKSLNSSAGSAGALIPEVLEQAFTQTVLLLAPELAMVNAKFLRGKDIEFNRILSLPSAGSAAGELSTTSITSSTTERAVVPKKIFKRKGSVTDFLFETSLDFVDSLGWETENQLQSMAYDLQNCILWGNANADTYTYSGLDRMIATHRQNLATGQVQTSLALLDKMISRNHRLNGIRHLKSFVCSPELLSQLSSLWTVVRDTRAAMREGTIEAQLVTGGYLLESYRGVPFVESTATRPTYKNEITLTEHMGSIALAATGAGSVLGAGTYYIRVAPINRNGEQIASPGNNSIVITTEDQINITFTAVPDTYYYKVYLGATSGTEKLIKEVSAFTYDGNGTKTGVIASIALTSVTADSSVPTHMQNDIPLDRDGTSKEPMEILILWDVDEVQGLGRYRFANSGGSSMNNLITVEQMARVEDRTDFLIKHYGALADSLEKTSYMVRGIRVA